ncbi:MAG: hypothetical protein A2728_02155 [Candidatus Spechtbacteria bacterium RIFCSPHIGHO2_01_FULL_38_11]|nr:MAG: hypothetical protein A2728_02155 [Candidatus Spechtbacteria bacterium RIFCSPHIGHO2_01_FULL_38_11]
MNEKKSLYVALYEDTTDNISNFMTFVYKAGTWEKNKLQKVFAKLFAKEYGLRISDAPEAYIYEIKSAFDVSGKEYQVILKSRNWGGNRCLKCGRELMPDVGNYCDNH